MQDNKKGQQLETLNYLSKGNQFVLYLFRKISKVSQAIYIITDTIKDAEPLKWTLRKTASETVSLRYFLDEQNVFDSLEKMLLETESHLDFARGTRVLSEMNAEIVQNEIRKLLTEIKESSQTGFYGGELNYPFFDIPKPAPILPEHIFGDSLKDKADQHKSHKGHSVLYDFYKPLQKRGFSVKDSTTSAPQSKGERRGEILKVIRIKGEVTIKDITDKVKDCSEKTVQRELTAMVLQGVIKKTGERRWSRYSVS